MRNSLIVTDACKLVAEVKHKSGKDYWIKTVSTLKAHYDGGDWRLDSARELIRRQVREAKQSLLSSADTPAVDLATDALLVETLSEFMLHKRECQHPRKQRQSDEYYCPACNKRWEIDSDEEE